MTLSYNGDTGLKEEFKVKSSWSCGKEEKTKDGE